MKSEGPLEVAPSVAANGDPAVKNDAPFDGFEERFYRLLEAADLNPRGNLKQTLEELGLSRSQTYYWFSSEAPPILRVREAVIAVIDKLQLAWDVNACLAYLYFGIAGDIGISEQANPSAFRKTPMVSEIMRSTVFIARIAAEEGHNVGDMTDQQLIDIFWRIRIYCETRHVSLHTVLTNPSQEFLTLVKNQLKLVEMSAL